MKRVALVVGINYDALPPGVPQGARLLRFAETDAQVMADALRASEYRVTLLQGAEATHDALLDALNTHTAGPHDLLLIYFAGHGGLDQQGHAYLLPVDADPAKLYLRGLRLDTFVRDYLQAVGSAVVL